MIQGGDPDSKTATYTSVENPTPLGNSDVPTENGEKEIKAEILYPQFFHKRGALCAAREGDDKNPEFKSSTSQFYITWGKWPVQKGKNPYKECLEYYEGYQQSGTPWLDGGYTVFGQVVSGLDVVDKIAAVKTGNMDMPVEPVTIISVTIEK
jgi:cyclophilin family peptidyl-prolyl cis-trans isomerase